MNARALFLLPLLLVACAPSSAGALQDTVSQVPIEAMNVRLDRQHPKAELPAAGLAFELRNIIDSRCPANVQCV